jgi:hypothetical protein
MPYDQGSQGSGSTGSFPNSTSFAVNSILSSDNVTVLGGPARLEVDLNIGASGTRGSLFFVGTQNPNSLNPNLDFPSLPIVFDIFINVNAASEDYLQAYQYVNQEGINTWVPTFNINQKVYSVNKVLEFVAGEATALLNVSDLGLDTLPFENLNNSFAYFNVQATVSNIDLENQSSPAIPCAFSLTVGDAYFDNSGSFDPGEFPLFLPVVVKAVEFNGTAWSAINNKKTSAYFAVSFANPNEIFSIISQNNGGEE